MSNNFQDETNAQTDFKVLRKWRMATDIIGLELARADGGPLLTPLPGAHIELALPAGGKPLLRHYSLCNAPHERDRYVIAVKQESDSRGGSTYIHESLKEGDILQVAGPRDQFPPVAGAPHHLLIAGGIGITPMLSMAQHLTAQHENFELHYFARSLDHVAFMERMNGLDTAFHLRLGLSPDDTERATRAAIEAAPAGSHIYVCGPAPLISMVEQFALPKLGPTNFHCEHFGQAATIADQEHEFDVELRKSGVVCRVGADQTIAGALEAAGHCVYVSCEQGVCGTCLTGVLAGTPDHRDVYLSAAEKQRGDQILICVSRAKSATIVLDL